jgi:glycosyltransferase involved in cell wall biosynthesis
VSRAEVAATPGTADDADAAHASRPSVAILVDDLATWVVSGLQPTGIQRVVSELLDTALARTDIQAWPAVSGPDDAASGLPTLAEVTRASLRWDARRPEVGLRLGALRRARATVAGLPLPWRLRRAAREVYVRATLSAGGVARAGAGAPTPAPDILVAPGYVASRDEAHRLGRLADAGMRPRVIVYDLYPLTNPDWCVPGMDRGFDEAMRTLVPVVERVVTLSGEVAGQVASRYPDLAGRLRVAVPTLEAHAPRPAPGRDAVPPVVDGPYLLALSTVEPRKNIRAILDAWRIVRADPRAAGVQLVVAGRRGWRSEEIEAEIARDGAALGIVRLDHVTDAQVDALYRDCLATVHASWAEGFGLPARESVVRGIPTLMSSTIPRDGLPDGTYALFDPADPAAFAALVLDVVERRPARTPIALGPGTGWEPVLSALVD